MVGKKKLSVTEPRRRQGPPRAEPVRLAPGSFVRIFVFAALAILVAAWAIWRHYTVPRAKMLVPKPASSEIEIEPAP
jgi:hypothetical protein